uniref:Uncharacterized protein n=1 Tax=Onchocerca volvulus TaxID=6282 RepID=A0A8R1TN15_ONCVO
MQPRTLQEAHQTTGSNWVFRHIWNIWTEKIIEITRSNNPKRRVKRTTRNIRPTWAPRKTRYARSFWCIRDVRDNQEMLVKMVGPVDLGPIGADGPVESCGHCPQPRTVPGY